MTVPDSPAGPQDSGGPQGPGGGDLHPEDAKLVVLARSAAARSGGTGAAVRDAAGRTYLSGPVEVGPLQLGAVEAAVVQAAGSGTTRLEAVAVVGDERPDPRLLAAVGDPVVVRA